MQGIKMDGISRFQMRSELTAKQSRVDAIQGKLTNTSAYKRVKRWLAFEDGVVNPGN